MTEKEYKHQYYLRNKEKIKARSKKRYLRVKDDPAYKAQRNTWARLRERRNRGYSLEDNICRFCGKRIRADSKYGICRGCKSNSETIRVQILKHYGKECACCGETEPLFLTIDHINNDGALHRGQRNRGMFRWLAEHNFPNDPNLQVLCWNCNSGKYLNNGVCPHEINRREEESKETDYILRE